MITELCESVGLDEYWRLAHKLIAACEGADGDEDALRVFVEELKPRERELLASQPASMRCRTDSEPTRPPEPVMIAVLTS